jgi:hypothetical protein
MSKITGIKQPRPNATSSDFQKVRTISASDIRRSYFGTDRDWSAYRRIEAFGVMAIENLQSIGANVKPRRTKYRPTASKAA